MQLLAIFQTLLIFLSQISFIHTEKPGEDGDLRAMSMDLSDFELDWIMRQKNGEERAPLRPSIENRNRNVRRTLFCYEPNTCSDICRSTTRSYTRRLGKFCEVEGICKRKRCRCQCTE